MSEETLNSESELSEISDISEFEDSGESGESGYLDGSYSSEATLVGDGDHMEAAGEIEAETFEERPELEVEIDASNKSLGGAQEAVTVSEADSQTAGPSGLQGRSGNETSGPRGANILRLMDSLQAEQPREVVMSVMTSIVNAAADEDYDSNIRYDQIMVANRVITEAVRNDEDVTFLQIYTALSEMESEE